MISVVLHGAILAIALSCIAPLFAGGMTPGGRLFISLCAFAAAAYATASGRRSARRGRQVALLVGAIGVLGLLQWAPLPSPVVRLLSPASAEAHAAAAAALGPEEAAPAASISIAPEETLASTVLVFAFAAIVYASAALPARWVPEAFILAGLLQVMLGSFVIRNQDASFLHMPLAVAVATALTGDGATRRWSIVATAVFTVAIAATGSRGGIATALMMIAFLLLWNGRPAGLAATAAGGSALAVAAVILTADPRNGLWRYSIEAWSRFPLFGSGLGSFADAFASVDAPESIGIVAHAHNSVLQIAVTAGAAGALLAIAALATVISSWFRRTPLGLGAAGATLALVIHGMIDFNLSIPGIVAPYLCLLGAALQETSDRLPAERD
jgi:O-antigen ligase